MKANRSLSTKGKEAMTIKRPHVSTTTEGFRRSFGRPSPQHGTPEPRHARQPETIQISSDESSSDGESDDEEMPDGGQGSHGFSKASVPAYAESSTSNANRDRNADVQQTLKSSLKRPFIGSILEESAKKKVRVITPSEEKAIVAEQQAKSVPQTRESPIQAPVSGKKRTLGGYLDLSSMNIHHNANDKIAGKSVPKNNHTKSPGDTSIKEPRKVSPTSASSVPKPALTEEVLEPRRDSGVTSTSLLRLTQNKPVTNSGTTSSSDETGSSDSEQEDGGPAAAHDPAAEQKRRARLEKEAYKRWEKRNAERIAKGEPPEPFDYKPQAPRRKRDQAEGGEPGKSAEAAPKKAKEKRKPKQKPNRKTGKVS